MQKPLSRPALLLALILSAGALSPAVAQDNNPLINSGALLEKASSLYDSGAYKQAIHLYQQVDRNDTNYARALYGIALCYEEDSVFDQAIHYSQLGLTAGNDPLREPDLYNVYANSLKASGQMERALRVFDSAIHKYPAYSLLYLNKGTALYTMKRFPEAEAVFKQALMIDPYSYSSHFKLGMVAMEQGKMVPAFLSFIGYLLMTPEGRFQPGCITMLKAIAHNEDNIQEYLAKRKETPSENYQLLEEIIQSKIALDPNYKLLIRLDDPI
ncbi:MAG TPA: tetratricopeptide repeat protein, partial [Chitinophagaceae bacterium]